MHFIEASMLHWPDSMATFADGDKILFSNDAFGQHYASDMLYADLVDQWGFGIRSVEILCKYRRSLFKAS